MKNMILGLLCLTACGEATDLPQEFQDAETEMEVGEVQQPVLAACLKDQGNPQYGVRSAMPWARCNPGTHSNCTLPRTKKPYEVALTGSGWSSGDRLEWGIGGTRATNFFHDKFTAWHAVIVNPFEDYYWFNPQTFDTTISIGMGLSSAELQFIKNYIGIQKVAKPNPSWWNNRATTQSAPLSDFVNMACISGIPLTSSTTTAWTQCDQWTAAVDYDRLRTWATSRNHDVQKLIESVVKKLMVWSMGLGSGSGSGGKITDANLYTTTTTSANPTGFMSASWGDEMSWVNNYQITGQGFLPAIDQCIAACGFNGTCQENCKRVVHCTLE